MPCTRERRTFVLAVASKFRRTIPTLTRQVRQQRIIASIATPRPVKQLIPQADIPHFPDGVFQDCRAVQLGYATMVQREGSPAERAARRDVAPLETEATAGLFGAYFGNAESPIQGEGFADETPAERRRRRRRPRGRRRRRPRRPRSATGSGSGSGSSRRRRHFESP